MGRQGLPGGAIALSDSAERVTPVYRVRLIASGAWCLSERAKGAGAESTTQQHERERSDYDHVARDNASQAMLAKILPQIRCFMYRQQYVFLLMDTTNIASFDINLH